MKRVFSYIVEVFGVSKTALSICILSLLFLSYGCKPPEAVTRYLEKLPPQALERLARLPYLGPYFLPRVAPQQLKERVKKLLEEAQLNGGPVYAPELYQKAQDYWLKALEYYQDKRFLWAKYYLKKALQAAEETIQKSQERRQQAQEIRLEKLKALEKLWRESFPAPTPQERLDWELKFKELALLVKQERFEEFDQKWKTLWSLLKQKRGPKPPLKGL